MQRFVLLIPLLLLCTSCQQPESVETPMEAEAIQEPSELTDLLPAGASNEMIAGHLLEAEHRAIPTRALSMHYADMDRETGYAVQLLAMGEEISQGGRLVGWKMGGTRMTDPEATPDPSFAYMLYTDSLANHDRRYPDAYVGDSVLVEAEIAFIIGETLEGPIVTKSQLTESIESVAGAIELISVRVLPTAGGPAPSADQMIAARLSHAGFLLGDERLDIGDVDLVEEMATVEIDGVEQASGQANQIMNSNPLDALLWLANELPKRDMSLRAGDVVITGGLYDNPTLLPGQTAVVRFSSLGNLSVSLAE